MGVLQNTACNSLNLSIHLKPNVYSIIAEYILLHEYQYTLKSIRLLRECCWIEYRQRKCQKKFEKYYSESKTQMIEGEDTDDRRRRDII